MVIRQLTTRAAAAAMVAALLLAGCGDDEGAEPGSATDGVASTTLDPAPGEPTIPDLPDNDDPAAIRCTAPPRGVFDATATVGESVGAARAAARAEGCSIRVAIRDGEGLALTEDYRPDRVNVAVAAGEVTEIVSIG